MRCEIKYRKKPIIIDAFQYGFDVDPEWFKEFKHKRYVPARNLKKSEENKFPSDILIMTLEGEMRVEYYDWVIKGIKGEIYPCKSDIFEASYEIVE